MGAQGIHFLPVLRPSRFLVHAISTWHTATAGRETKKGAHLDAGFNIQPARRAAYMSTMSYSSAFAHRSSSFLAACSCALEE